MKKIMIVLVAMMAAFAQADTDVYFTNNSDQPLTVDVFHWGSDRLVEGDEWFQHVDTIAPYETKMVLSFNRYVGVKWGDDYYFETRLTSPQGLQYRLNQKMTGTWWSSNLAHGVQAHDLSPRWFSDRTIHRFDTGFDQNQLAELATKADFTVRYDDLYYTLSPETQAPVAEGLSVMTYNIWALPLVASHIDDRLDLLPQYMKGYDVVMLQEVFAPGRDAFLAELAREYPYQTRMLDNNSVNIFDGGVTIVSRYPIVNQAQLVFPDCSGTDCFADKGINYAEVVKNGESYHLFATHAASFDTDEARRLRQEQFQMMRKFARDQGIPQNEMVIYGGDFNVNKLKFATSDYPAMLANLNASEPGYAGYTASTFDPRINSFAAEYDVVEYLDYILVSNEYDQSQSNINEVTVPRSTDARLWEHWDLSDHFPVSVDLQK
ncbi:sphingomyelin phosphodiesterase [Salinibius halmophilus]|uniref:sphingomyelin phosphodiesterase n=1 Tax=Salinibius halmophilus TaxID=1853216 RepID=UPI000E66C357|nr:sphingomyelin phosphodiesterase [Salinibius halmophilus]